LRTGISWAISLLVMIFPYRRFGTTYRSHFQGSSPEDSISHLFRGESLKSRKNVVQNAGP